jgi:hypothetical protein
MRLLWFSKNFSMPKAIWKLFFRSEPRAFGHRYVFERVVSGRHTGKAADFLEQEIVKEIYNSDFAQ